MAHTCMCEQCQRSFEVDFACESRRFCSRTCWRAYVASHKSPRNTRQSETCPVCGKVFEVKVSEAQRRHWCSFECMAIGKRRKRQIVIEQKFGKPIFVLLYDLYCIQKLGIKQCARRLGVSDRNLWSWFEDLGITRRERSDAVALQWTDNAERRQQQSERVKDDFRNGKRDPNILVRIAKSDWARKRNSESKQGSRNPMYNKLGRRNPLWKGGKVTYRGRGWLSIRQQAIRRDEKRCQLCGASERLQVHHITPYRETQDNRLSNLITLCIKCHSKVESNPSLLQTNLVG